MKRPKDFELKYLPKGADDRNVIKMIEIMQDFGAISWLEREPSVAVVVKMIIHEVSLATNRNRRNVQNPFNTRIWSC